jgi:hypothetical protein
MSKTIYTTSTKWIAKLVKPFPKGHTVFKVSKTNGEKFLDTDSNFTKFSDKTRLFNDKIFSNDPGLTMLNNYLMDYVDFVEIECSTKSTIVDVDKKKNYKKGDRVYVQLDAYVLNYIKNDDGNIIGYRVTDKRRPSFWSIIPAYTVDY